MRPPTGLGGVLTSLRTTVVLMCVIAAFLLLNVVVPQARVVGEEAFSLIIRDRPVIEFFLVDLGLGNLSTSPLFLLVLGLFFVNLTAVLLARLGPTWRRIQPKSRSVAGLRAWAQSAGSLNARLPTEWGFGVVVARLKEFGFKVRKVGDRTVSGVRHRLAPLGFLIFHMSFFLLCAGGVLLYYSRFEGVVTLSETQEFTGEYSQIVRQPPIGGAPDLRFVLEEVDPRFEQGEPVHLGAVFSFQQGTSIQRRTARVNYPAEWGPTVILVQRAGLTPVIWLQDGEGYTLDRVAVAATTRGEEGTWIELAGGRYLMLIEPLAPEIEFPSHEDLVRTPMKFQVYEEGKQLFSETLRPGEAGQVGSEARLVFEDLRYWAGVRVISERGGGLLIAGFLMGVVGLMWRLLWQRREVAVTWDDERFWLAGESEYYQLRFREEMAELFARLKEGELVDRIDEDRAGARADPLSAGSRREAEG
jgi:hypothetical protein